ncbi:MAG: NADH-quinone oxidoreductase subunit M [Candidatus Kapabacteria bacterium]|nr:NADH-quinone oxidoreductase subunit M [Candidatus Kapabacteria bacterium]
MGVLSLLLTLFVPLLGAIAVLFINKEQSKAIKSTAFVMSIVTFLLSLLLLPNFDSSNPTFQYVVNQLWIPSLDAGFRIGLDGMSLLLVLLTTFIMPIAIASSFSGIKKREKEYYAMLLILQFGMTGVFVALDTFLFYVFWELILIPMFFIIGVWGGKDKIYASIKFFLYTLVGSLLMLVAIIWIGLYAKDPAVYGKFTTDLVAIKGFIGSIPYDIQVWLFLAFAISFCIKVPLFPLHTWLPDAHVQAPTAGSVILAGVLLKMGTYGLIRFNLELFPLVSSHWATPIAWLSVIGIIYGALVAMVQTDVKKLVAYSSVSHLGFVVLGIFSMTVEGIQGAIIQMVNHGLSTPMLFLCVGVIYDRRHTREISEYGGIARVMPIYTVLFAIAMFASVGLPGLNGFVGEYLTLIGAFVSPVYNNTLFAILSATGVIFAAVYLLWMWQRVMFGTNDNPENQNLQDVTKQELWQMIPLVVFIVWIGVYPGTFLKFTEASTRALVGKIEAVNGISPRYNSLPTIQKASHQHKQSDHKSHNGADKHDNAHPSTDSKPHK